MCLLLLAYHAHLAYRLVLAANRDEAADVDPEAYMREVAASSDRYIGFNLIAGDASKVLLVDSAGRVDFLKRPYYPDHRPSTTRSTSPDVDLTLFTMIQLLIRINR